MYEKAKLLLTQTKRLNTVDSLHMDLKALGILEGDALIVHSSLSSLGEVIGRQEVVDKALLRKYLFCRQMHLSKLTHF